MIKPEIIKSCSFCNDNFTSSKSTARFCCNSCRTKANVKRRRNEQAKAEQEVIYQQESELLNQKADARRSKREQKAELKRQEKEKQAAKDRRDSEDKKIQEEIDAFESTEKNRLINTIVGMIRVKAEAKESQLLADKQRKKNDDRIRFENQMKKARENGEMIGKELADFIKSLSNINKNTGNTSTQPGPIITPTLSPKPGMPSQMGQTSPHTATKPVRKSIVEDILDQLNIF